MAIPISTFGNSEEFGMRSIELTAPPGAHAAPIATTRRSSAAARCRIIISYLWRHGRLPNLDAPTRFTELVQLRKLHDRATAQTMMMDKFAAKQLAANSLGADWIVPTLWLGSELPAQIPFSVPAIVKARHGCNQYVVLSNLPAAQNWDRMRRLSRRWQRAPYGTWLDEWAYRDVPRGLIVEPLLGGSLPLPIDYKIYVFGGRATHVQVHLDRGGRHRWILHDRNWNPLVDCNDRPTPPASLAAMLEAAEVLSRGMSFLRVDFYEVGGRPYFGEFCLYPGSGFDPFAADWIDESLGSLWLSAMKSARPGS